LWPFRASSGSHRGRYPVAGRGARHQPRWYYSLMIRKSTVLCGPILANVAVFASCAGPHRSAALVGGYFGQDPPGLRPALFSPGVVPTPDAVELNGVFSPDFTEFFFTRMALPPGGN